jgi:hypothetical protein
MKSTLTARLAAVLPSVPARPNRRTNSGAPLPPLVGRELLEKMSLRVRLAQIRVSRFMSVRSFTGEYL